MSDRRLIVRPPVSVGWRAPFAERNHVRTLAPCEMPPTIGEILATTPDVPVWFADACEARVNGELVPRALWHMVRPRLDPVVPIAVTFSVPLQGGSLRTIASIAVLLAAAAVSGGTLLPAIGFLSAGVVSSIAGASIGIIGSLAIAALAPPPTLAATPQAPGAEVSQQQGSLTGNVLAPGGPLPHVIGTRRVFPPLLCRPLVDLVGDKEFVEVVMGLAGAHAQSAPRAGDIDMANIAEAVVNLCDGLPGSPRQTLVNRYGFTAEPNVDLVGHLVNTTTQSQLQNQSDPDSSSPQWFSLVSRFAPDEIWLTLDWPSGLSKTDESTLTINQVVRLRLRRRGDVAWINCPEIHFSSNSPNPFAKTIRLIWGTKPSPPSTPPTDKGPVYAYADVPGQSGVSPTTSGWTAAAYFGGGSGSLTLLQASNVASSGVLNTELGNDRAVFYLDAATYPQDAVYEIQVMRAQPYKASKFTQTTYITTGGLGGAIGGPHVYDFFQYYVFSSVNSLVFDHANMLDQVKLTRVASVKNDNPIQGDNIATVSVRTSRALGQISVQAAGYTYDWDGTGWNTLTTTSNPAPHMYDVLAGPLGARPVPVDIVDSASLVAFRQFCIDNDLTANAVVEGRTRADVLAVVAAAGYGKPWQSEKYGVTYDRDRSADTAVQIFTPRNTRDFKWIKAFADQPTGLRVSFQDVDSDYAPTERIIYDDPSNPDASRLEAATYDPLVDSDDVDVRARYDLDQARLRAVFYQFVADDESLIAQRGDLIGVQTDVLTRQAGFAYVGAVLKSGGNITGLILDGSVPVDTEAGLFSVAHVFTTAHIFTLGSKTGMAIRLLNGAGILIKEITAASNDEVTTISFVTPFADPGANLAQGCLCAVGPLGNEFKRLIVFAVTPSQGSNVTVTAVDEAPELFA